MGDLKTSYELAMEKLKRKDEEDQTNKPDQSHSVALTQTEKTSQLIKNTVESSPLEIEIENTIKQLFMSPGERPYLEKTVQEHPEILQVRARLGQVYLNANEYELAHEQLYQYFQIRMGEMGKNPEAPATYRDMTVGLDLCVILFRRNRLSDGFGLLKHNKEHIFSRQQGLEQIKGKQVDTKLLEDYINEQNNLLLRLINLYQLTFKPDEVLECIQLMRKNGFDNVRVKLTASKAYYRKKNLDKSLEELTNALKESQEKGNDRNLEMCIKSEMIQIYLHRERYEEADNTLKSMIASDPNYPQLHIPKAQILYAKGMLEECIRELEADLQIKPPILLLSTQISFDESTGGSSSFTINNNKSRVYFLLANAYLDLSSKKKSGFQYSNLPSAISLEIRELRRKAFSYLFKSIEEDPFYEVAKKKAEEIVGLEFKERPVVEAQDRIGNLIGNDSSIGNIVDKHKKLIGDSLNEVYIAHHFPLSSRKVLAKTTKIDGDESKRILDREFNLTQLIWDAFALRNLQNFVPEPQMVFQLKNKYYLMLIHANAQGLDQFFQEEFREPDRITVRISQRYHTEAQSMIRTLALLHNILTPLLKCEGDRYFLEQNYDDYKEKTYLDENNITQEFKSRFVNGKTYDKGPRLQGIVNDIESAKVSKFIRECEKLYSEVVYRPKAIIHGDAHPGNFLSGGIIIDFEKMAVGNPLRDLASATQGMPLGYVNEYLFQQYLNQVAGGPVFNAKILTPGILLRDFNIYRIHNALCLIGTNLGLGKPDAGKKYLAQIKELSLNFPYFRSAYLDFEQENEKLWQSRGLM